MAALANETLQPRSIVELPSLSDVEALANRTEEPLSAFSMPRFDRRKTDHGIDPTRVGVDVNIIVNPESARQQTQEEKPATPDPQADSRSTFSVLFNRVATAAQAATLSMILAGAQAGEAGLVLTGIGLFGLSCILKEIVRPERREEQKREKQEVLTAQAV
jgi:hypothetical protein